jgi:hypothetical protein
MQYNATHAIPLKSAVLLVGGRKHSAGQGTLVGGDKTYPLNLRRVPGHPVGPLQDPCTPCNFSSMCAISPVSPLIGEYRHIAK